MIVDKQAKEFERDKLVYYMTGQEIEVTPFQYRKISDKPVLELENCSQHGSFYDISFKLCAGEILGITGQLGSGRTELAKALSASGRSTWEQSKSMESRKRLRISGRLWLIISVMSLRIV